MSDYEKRYLKKKEKQLVLWRKMVDEIFGEKPLETLKTTSTSRIIEILNTIGKSEALNHTFMPSGGGLDLTGATYSNEKGRVELLFGETVLIVNPESLTFHPIGENPEWWYFRLNTLPFEPSGVYEEMKQKESSKDIFKTKSDCEVEFQMKFYGEEVLEIEPGKYLDRSFWDTDYLGYDENGDLIPLPENARIITRKFNGGSFVIFPKFSAYNHNPATYDARHNKVNDEDFHQYIREIVDR